MKLSVIIPTCNRNDLLALCLEKLAPGNQTLPFENYEVIVTDDNKNNNAKQLIENNYPWAKWVEGPQKGPAANRNNGVREARGKWLVFTDDDCLPHYNWLNVYYNAILTNKFLVLEGKTVADRPQKRFDEIAPINIYGNNLWSCNFAIQKNMFIKIDGFDESFTFAMEDVDFHFRLKAKTEILFLNEALVIHPWRRVIPFKNTLNVIKAKRIFNRKHKNFISFRYRVTRIMIFFVKIYKNLVALKKFKFKGWLVYIDSLILDFCLIFI
jgi:GT2 family glycosyltransferase